MQECFLLDQGWYYGWKGENSLKKIENEIKKKRVRFQKVNLKTSIAGRHQKCEWGHRIDACGQKSDVNVFKKKSVSKVSSWKFL